MKTKLNKPPIAAADCVHQTPKAGRLGVLLLVVLMGLGPNYALSAETITMEEYVVAPKDTLSEIIFRKRIVPWSQLYGKRGWVARNMRINPQIRNWRRLLPGQALRLELPGPKAVVGDESPTTNDPPRDESPTAPQTDLQVEKRDTEPAVTPTSQQQYSLGVTIGYGLNAHMEIYSGDTTNTRGQSSLPRLGVEASTWRTDGSDSMPTWQYTGWMYLSRLSKVGGIGFPYAWNIGADIRNWIGIESFFDAKASFSPILGLEAERFSQASPSSSNPESVFLVRNTSMLWARLGVTLTLKWNEARWLEFAPTLLRSSIAQSQLSDGSGMVSVDGWGQDSKLTFGITPRAFGVLGIRTHSLGGQATLHRQSITFDLGWRF